MRLLLLLATTSTISIQSKSCQVKSSQVNHPSFPHTSHGMAWPQYNMQCNLVQTTPNHLRPSQPQSAKRDPITGPISPIQLMIDEIQSINQSKSISHHPFLTEWPAAVAMRSHFRKGRLRPP
ncbi:hypothetical protein TWF173_008450 [Orbilia oligospora]|nr:hypothetical protein TWF173_008450 [Orbilia oligospora]